VNQCAQKTKLYVQQYLTFILPGGYLNFSTWFTKNALFEQKKIKLRNEWHFVENKTHYAACLTNAVSFLVA
jgi:hypothetical protein